MPNCYTTFLDKFLTTVPVTQLDEASIFVSEVKLMCTDFLNQSPILLYKELPRDARSSAFFHTKNRHRSSSANGIIFNEAVQSVKAFERGLDVSTSVTPADCCVVILPDSFKLTFSDVSFAQFTESAALVDPALLGSFAFSTDVSQLTESAKHVIATDVPFYYCIRIN